MCFNMNKQCYLFLRVSEIIQIAEIVKPDSKVEVLDALLVLQSLSQHCKLVCLSSGQTIRVQLF